MKIKDMIKLVSYKENQARSKVCAHCEWLILDVGIAFLIYKDRKEEPCHTMCVYDRLEEEG